MEIIQYRNCRIHLRIDFYIRKSNIFYFEEAVPPGTFGDYICYLFGEYRNTIRVG